MAAASTSRSVFQTLTTSSARRIVQAQTARRLAAPSATSPARRFLSSSVAAQKVQLRRNSTNVVSDGDVAVETGSAVATAAPTLLPPTQFHPKTHGHHVATLHFSAFSPGAELENMLFFIDFALRAAYALGIPASQPAASPTRVSLWTVPKSPFVHKKAQENFERRTSRRSIRVWDANEEVVERWLHLLRYHEMPGVGMRAEIFRRRPLGIGKATLEAAQASLRQPKTGESVEANDAKAIAADDAKSSTPPAS